MKKLALTLVLLAFASSLFATTVTECSSDILALRGATQGAMFYGKNAEVDRANLIGKLANSQIKLNQAKLADAVQKLTDFRDKVSTLSTTGKIDAVDAAELVVGANDAILCIQTLG